MSVNHRTAAFLESYFDILFALNRQTHPGEKRLVQLCIRDCPVLPDRFAERMDQLFRDTFTDPQALSEALTGMVDALEDIL